jgi:TonB-linked SusC/RagA family outer membrane protein
MQRKTLCLFLTLLMLSVTFYAQSARITLPQESMTLLAAFSEIEKQTEMTIAYNEKVINVNRTLTPEVSNMTLPQAMTSILRGTNTTFRTEGKRILIVAAAPQPDAPAAQQPPQSTLTGTVTDENGDPLPGATVALQGSTRGVITSPDGTYTIQARPGDKLTISFIGYITQQATVGNQPTLNIQMVELKTELSELVVVGYGQQKKESVVAALTSISAEGLRQTPASNIGIALAGRMPGLTVLQRSGVPGGESMEFYIRGRSTVNGQQPLLMVDGVERDFSALDPREIETITILKDASATAVYGVRGANGVIMVTTRRGKAGKPVIDVTFEHTWQSPTRLPQMASAYDYALLRNQVETQNGRPPIYDPDALQHYQLGDSKDLYPVRNLIDEFTKDHFPLEKVNVNVSGGTDRMRYFTTVGYLYQEGLFPTQKYSEYDYDPESKAHRVNFRSNFDIELNTNLNMFLNISGYMQKKNDPVIVPFQPDYLSDVAGYSILLGSLFQTPNLYHNDVTPDGEVLSSSLKGGNVSNVPYGMLNRTGFRNTQVTQVTTTLGIEQKLHFITPGLSLKAIASYDATSHNIQIRQRSFQAYEAIKDDTYPNSLRYIMVGTATNSTLSDSQQQSFNNLFNIDASINYAQTFGQHTITGMLLYNRYQRTVNIQLPFNYIGFVGRATYGYANRYLGEINFGYNGSEQFAPGKKMGFFPSLSLGWVFTEENLCKTLIPWLTFAKLRASYGQVGNDQMGGSRFAFLTLWSGSYESQIGNDNLTWEKAAKYNLGIETRLNTGISFDADIFYEKRNNILIPAVGLVPTGVFGAGGVSVSGILPKINAGEVENRGFELTLGYQKQLNRDLHLHLTANTAFNRNKVLYMSEVLLPSTYAYPLRSTGYRLGQYFGYETAGFFNTEQDLLDWYDQSAIGAAPKLGDLKYRDKNGDGIISEQDQSPIGNPEIPEWTFGGALSLQYKSFDFSMMWQGVAGRSYYLAGQKIWETYNFNQWHKEAWSQERYDAHLPITYPRLEPGSNASKVTSDFWLRDGSYIRLKNIELGYTLPKNWSSKIGASTVRLYVNGLNLLTFDNYPVKYQDPEQNGELLYPVFKACNVGINVSF